MSTALNIFEFHTAQPFACLGLTHPFWSVNIDILIGTWVAMGVITALAIMGRHYLKRDFNPVSAAFQQAISVLMDLCKDSFGSFHYAYFTFVAAIFAFTFFSCAVGVIPFIEEATRDLNTTLAIALSSFLYVQYQKIKLHGIKGFLHEFIEPFWPMLPLHVIGELSKIASMSLRLFGNIMGGSIIVSLVYQLLGIHKVAFTIAAFSIIALSFMCRLLPLRQFHPFVLLCRCVNAALTGLFLVAWIQILLGICEGLIQSFVLTMLTITYLAMNLQHNNDSTHQDHA